MENQIMLNQQPILISQDQTRTTRKKKILVLVILTGILISALMILLYMNGRHILDAMPDSTIPISTEASNN